MNSHCSYQCKSLVSGESSKHQFVKVEQSRLLSYKTSQTMLFESDNDADPYYKYVTDILELSGFTQNVNESLHPWYSQHQPLNPSLFKESETLLLLHPRLRHRSIDDGRLVFDLVNEALVEISENSCIYFPNPCGISLMLKEGNIVEQVWREVGRKLDLQLEHDQYLDDIVGRDLEKDAWMMLQVEAEHVALELEHLVFYELLDELL